MSCPLCSCPDTRSYSKDKHREYFLCPDCSLVYVPRSALLTADAEKARYDTHNNDEADERYRAYLNEIILQMKPFIANGESALDFGSGRTDFLAKLMTEAGLKAEPFDIYYWPRQEIWGKKFDVIVMSEVIEHLRDLMPTMTRLKEILAPGGRMFIKTKFLPVDQSAFKNWYYKNDLTHVQFFNPTSVNKLSDLLGLEKPVFLSHDITLVKAFR